MNKFMKLGFLSSTALPLATVVACGPAALTEEQQKLLDKWTSPVGRNALERTWLEKLIIDYMIDNKDSTFTGIVGSKDNYKDVTFNREKLVVPQSKDSENLIIDKEVFASIPHVVEAFKFLVEESEVSEDNYITGIENVISKEAEFNSHFKWKEDEDGNVIPGQFMQTEGRDNINTILFTNPELGQSWLSAVEDQGRTPWEIWLTYSKGTKQADVTHGWTPEDSSTIPSTGLAGDTDGKVVLTTLDEKISWVMNTLFRSDELGLVNDLYKMLLSEQLYSLNHENWEKVFYEDYKKANKDGLTDIHKLIDKRDNFYMTMEVVDNKYAINLSFIPGDKYAAEFSTIYNMAGEIKKDDTNITNVVAEMDEHLNPGSPKDSVTHEEGQYPSVMVVIKEEEYNIFNDYKPINKYGFKQTTTPLDSVKDLLGYKGLKSFPAGKGNLKLENASDWKEHTEDDRLDGYYTKLSIADGAIANKDAETVALYQSDSDVAGSQLAINIDRYVSMLPLYEEITDGTTTEHALTFSGNSKWKDNLHIIAWHMYHRSTETVYRDILDYFTHEDGGNFTLKINSKLLYEKLKDAGIEFLKYEK